MEQHTHSAAEAAPVFERTEVRRHRRQMTPMELGIVEERVQGALRHHFENGGLAFLCEHSKERITSRLGFHLGWSKIKGILCNGSLQEFSRFILPDGREDVRVLFRSNTANHHGTAEISIVYSMTFHHVVTVWTNPVGQEPTPDFTKYSQVPVVPVTDAEA